MAWDGSASRFNDAQWRRSCILDRGAGATAKERYAIPVREPGGAVNKSALGAAAAALAGARGGVQAPAAAKKKAARALMRLYGQMDMEPPESMRRMAMM